MNIVTSATCTPYLAGNLPRFGEHIAWSESSAVCFSNSVIGARTNREGGPSALAAALCGVTPNYGYHLDENRKPQYLINVETELKAESDFGALGYFVGKIVKNKNPYFTGIKDATVDQLKSLGAAPLQTY
jgi:predicted aconitase